MGLMKRIGRSAPVRAAACFIAAAYIRLVHATSRWETVNRAAPEAFWKAGKPFILSFWHGRILMMPYCWPKGRRMNMLISRHRDGGLIADTIAWFGLGVVRGSTAKPGRERDKGAQAALMEMIRKLKGGEYVGITPDGPRGPRYKLNMGVIKLAQLTGAMILPVHVRYDNAFRFKTWDGFLLPKPFSGVEIEFGPSFVLPRRMTEEECEARRVELERVMIAGTGE